MTYARRYRTASCEYRKRPARYAGRAASSRFSEWRESGDRMLEIFICVGHVIGAVMLVAEHLL